MFISAENAAVIGLLQSGKTAVGAEQVRARDRATLLMTMPVPMIRISGSAVPIAVVYGCRGKVEGEASAIRGITVIVRRIGVGSRVPRIGAAAGVALRLGGS
jgi:hypothetical protein